MIVIKYHIPHYRTAPPVVDNIKNQIFHIFENSCMIHSQVPFSCRPFRKKQCHIRIGVVYCGHFRSIPAIIMICGSRNILFGLRIGIYQTGITYLSLPIIVAIIMVKHINFSVDIIVSERRTKGCLDEIALLFPKHKHRSAITSMERFVLRGDSSNVDAIFSKSLYPFHEIQGIILITFFT